MCRAQNLGLQLKGQSHIYGSAENPCPGHKGQLKTIVLCICLDLPGPYFTHSLKDYKVNRYKSSP